jgi:hypothetical protein
VSGQRTLDAIGWLAGGAVVCPTCLPRLPFKISAPEPVYLTLGDDCPHCDRCGEPLQGRCLCSADERWRR